MKKIIITTLAFTITFVKSYTQTQLGIKAGLNLAQIQNFEFFEQHKSKSGLNCGLLAQFKLNNKFFIQPEALYSVKGFKFTGATLNSSGGLSPASCVLSLNYISVPVLAGFRPNKKFYFLLGPEASFLINASTSVDEKKQNNTSTYNRFDIALDFGAVFNLNKRLAFDFRYSHGFRILSGAALTHPQIDYSSIRKGSNRTLQFDFVYLFNVH